MASQMVNLDTIIQEFVKRQRMEKDEKVRRFRYLNEFVRKGQIVFAGSSLMEQFPIYEFLLDDQLPFTIYNRGVGGFTTDEFLAAMEDCVFALEPAHLFLNIGTNDLNGPEYQLSHLIENYDKILQAIHERLPETKVYLLAYYPVNPTVQTDPYMQDVFQHRTNARICEASDAVRELAKRHGARFLDCNAELTDAEGNLKAEYTIEGMHMYANGYRPVLKALLPVLREITAQA